MIELDYIPDNWTKDQIKIYEIYSEYFADNKDGVDLQAVEELEKMLTRWLEESRIKIVSWNCNGKFREKFKEIIEEDADIYVIQECENPSESIDEDYREFAADNYIWTGHLHYKGLGIFAKDDIKLEKLEYEGEFEHFIPVRVNDSFNLLGVWAMPKYVEMIHDFFDANENIFDENLVMCGDFNSSVVFNYHHPKAKNHTELNKKLESKNLISVYHDLTGDEQGSEKSMTFYQARHLNNPFYLDFVYAGENVVKEFTILDHYKWITVSDHLPLVFKI
ncbi:endonuclease/exonuclease/phosphatase family protein [uncultured Methanobrevibacter sp.]|uniref:endonuclease/exonuclease/phosphatase family protein n=1 Tax=uncultured Methanobrevibacter sp. TaxID=253161 RepID=UPI00260281E6|nr:endonuclease/exonuclease/phosphatase family protein [uncultured Methanobrevibacter sp.]